MDMDFVCKNCGKKVGTLKYGGHHRNHCPICLFSLHVDKKISGDRGSGCYGLMKPVSYFQRRTGEFVLVHRCLKCQVERFNRIAGDDDLEKVKKLVKTASRKGDSQVKQRLYEEV